MQFFVFFFYKKDYGRMCHLVNNIIYVKKHLQEYIESTRKEKNLKIKKKNRIKKTIIQKVIKPEKDNLPKMDIIDDKGNDDILETKVKPIYVQYMEKEKLKPEKEKDILGKTEKPLFLQFEEQKKKIKTRK